jgi:hypothetical protein
MNKNTKQLAMNDADRATLRGWLRAQNTLHSLAQRAKIVLLLDEGRAPSEVITKLDVARPTVFKWRNRYAAQGIEGLRDRSRQSMDRIPLGPDEDRDWLPNPSGPKFTRPSRGYWRSPALL